MLSYLVTWTILKKKKATQTVCFQVVVSKQNLFASELELVVRAKKKKKKKRTYKCYGEFVSRFSNIEQTLNR